MVGTSYPGGAYVGGEFSGGPVPIALPLVIPPTKVEALSLVRLVRPVPVHAGAAVLGIHQHALIGRVSTSVLLARRTILPKLVGRLTSVKTKRSTTAHVTERVSTVKLKPHETTTSVVVKKTEATLLPHPPTRVVLIPRVANLKVVPRSSSTSLPSKSSKAVLYKWPR